MNRYIFITTEGFTFQPGSQNAEPDAENMQVLGFGKGNTAEEAIENMTKENGFLVETTFDEVIAIELKSDTRKYFSLKKVLGKSE